MYGNVILLPLINHLSSLPPPLLLRYTSTHVTLYYCTCVVWIKKSYNTLLYLLVCISTYNHVVLALLIASVSIFTQPVCYFNMICMFKYITTHSVHACTFHVYMYHAYYMMRVHACVTSHSAPHCICFNIQLGTSARSRSLTPTSPLPNRTYWWVVRLSVDTYIIDIWYRIYSSYACIYIYIYTYSMSLLLIGCIHIYKHTTQLLYTQNKFCIRWVLIEPPPNTRISILTCITYI